MTNKRFWCGILIVALIVALTVVLPLPARAANAARDGADRNCSDNGGGDDCGGNPASIHHRPSL